MSVVAAVGVAAGLAVFTAPAMSATQSVKPTRLNVGVQILHFTAAGKTVRGTGLVSAALTSQSGQVRTVRTTVAFTAAAARSCSVLNLVLNQLHLNLLGLNVDLAKVVVNITGIPSGRSGGGALGSLFCTLARAHLAGDRRAAAARSLTTALQAQRDRLVRFAVNLMPTATASAAGATCPVLDLIVGPLHVDLLGLAVDLNQVHLTVTAVQGGGVLGSLFCSLSHATATVPTTP